MVVISAFLMRASPAALTAEIRMHAFRPERRKGPRRLYQIVAEIVFRVPLDSSGLRAQAGPGPGRLSPAGLGMTASAHRKGYCAPDLR